MASARHKVLTGGGLLLIAAALFLTAYNLREARLAAQTAEEALQQLETSAPISKQEHKVQVLPEPEPAVPDYVLDPDMEMPTQEVDGNRYIGVLEIPSLDLELPIISQWSDARLKIAPCRYLGSAYLNDLIIAGHNYKKHFGGLHNLTEGDEVIFTDMADNRFAYTVSLVEQLPGTAIEEMEAGDWDLTLFTCTIGGKARVTVRCVLDTD